MSICGGFILWGPYHTSPFHFIPVAATMPASLHPACLRATLSEEKTRVYEMALAILPTVISHVLFTLSQLERGNL
jgi:hypothetical protein